MRHFAVTGTVGMVLLFGVCAPAGAADVPGRRPPREGATVPGDSQVLPKEFSAARPYSSAPGAAACGGEAHRAVSRGSRREEPAPPKDQKARTIRRLEGAPVGGLGALAERRVTAIADGPLSLPADTEVGVCPGDGSCCEAHLTPGCESMDCCETVCSLYPLCCVLEWDSGCVEYAMTDCPWLCGDPCCGLSPGDPVRLLADDACGTVMCCDFSDSTYPVMVSLDAYTGGGGCENCQFCDNGTCCDFPGSYLWPLCNQVEQDWSCTPSCDYADDYQILADSYAGNTVRVSFGFSEDPGPLSFSIDPVCGSIGSAVALPAADRPCWVACPEYQPCDDENLTVTVRATPTKGPEKTATVDLNARLGICGGEEEMMCVSTYDESGDPAPAEVCVELESPDCGTTTCVIPSTCTSSTPMCGTSELTESGYVFCAMYRAGTCRTRVRVEFSIANPAECTSEKVYWSFDQNGDTTYCEACAYHTDYEYIRRVTVGDIDHPSGSDGCADYSGVGTELQIDETYGISVYVGERYQTDIGGGWVDWDGDGDFCGGNERFSLNWVADDLLTGIVWPPVGAALGPTRMRIRIQDSYYDPRLSACRTIAWGEVEDYTVIVIPPPCGDGSCEPGENCETCPSDCACDTCHTCIGGVCQPCCDNGDIDTDGDVDLRDFAVLQICFDPTSSTSPGCERAALDCDDDVDLGDYRRFNADLGEP